MIEEGLFMSNAKVLEMYDALPAIFKCRVQYLLISLIRETREAGVNLEKINKLGTLMTDDFNEPMKDFHDYMYNIDVEFVNKIEKLPLKFQMEIEAKVDEMLNNAEQDKA